MSAKTFFTLWMCVASLHALLLAAAAAVRCSEPDARQALRPRTGVQGGAAAKLTDCLMECTGMTYVRKLQLEDNHNIRLQDSTEGDLGEYCWSAEIKCNVGESLQRAYAVLPVDASAVGHEQVEVRGASSAAAATWLRAHTGPTTLADNCGLRYDVTEHFSAANSGTSFCVQVATPVGVPGDSFLKCPPFLATIWQRNPNQSDQLGGG